MTEKSVSDPSFDLSATASSGLAVSFTSSDESIVSINGITVTILSIGEVQITASQPGDNIYNAATDVVHTLIINEEIITGLADQELVNIGIYPNPTPSYLNIELNSNKSYTIKLVDMTGRTWVTKSSQTTSTTLDLINMPRGYYILNVQDENSNGTISKRIIKN